MLSLIHIFFDPGNMVNEGFEDYQKSFELLGDYIAHIHIKNGILAPDGEDELGACKWKRVWTPLKKGMADLKKLFNYRPFCVGIQILCPNI